MRFQVNQVVLILSVSTGMATSTLHKTNLLLATIGAGFIRMHDNFITW